MTAADLIRGWSENLTAGYFMTGVVTATQSGTADAGSGSVAAYSAITLTKNGDGSIGSSPASVLFSDRQASIAGRPIQPFDAAHGDSSAFTLSLDGLLHIHSVTWNGNDVIVLQDMGNGVMAGLGASIGNTGHRALWVVAVDPTIARIPG
ncbi:hypothetical protein [Labedaea rhizosphaerae]|uniref:Uncharacterized protein n=1 Tax=Labedaea rhizosphaerae TaxID=598644 RepID=A0A4R6SFX2_LABRH|nr:hypothetical protein [Labedaea rhizosphaerae]TDQ00524.1 hypothetical protein EV186_102385 [Labedaea rhizosphaerae]